MFFFRHVIVTKSDYFYSFVLQWYKLWLWFLYSVVFVHTVLVLLSNLGSTITVYNISIIYLLL